jgi:glucuronate isomerase
MAGIYRNHNPEVFSRYGADKGFDIPIKTEYTQFTALGEAVWQSPSFSLILFTLDETTYMRELAPLAGVYLSVKLGLPWWIVDSWNGMRRYFNQMMETGRMYNTIGIKFLSRSE